MKRIKLLSIIWLLLLFLTGCGCSIETVDEHNRKADSEAYERSSALEELLSSKAAAIEESTYEYILVHITITCSKAVGHKDLNTSADIPENGIFLDKDIAVKSGSSVYDALITALKDNNINYTENSGYITGINNLNEKECGKYSGWKFRVNNVYPNVGCSGYTLSDGDNILWGYVLSHTDIY